MPVSPKNAKTAAAIDAAARKLRLIGEDIETEILLYVQTICMIANGTSEPGLAPEWRDAGPRQVNSELERLAKYSTKLADLIDGLHQPTILALSNSPALVLQNGTPARLNVSQVRKTLSIDLRVLAQAAAKAPLDDLVDGKARRNHANPKVAGVTRIASATFRKLTKTEPNTSRRPDGFLCFLAATFAALSIDANVERATKDLLQDEDTSPKLS